MRTITAILTCIILFGCSKNSDPASGVITPPINPVNPGPINTIVNNDTLATGWTSSYIPGLGQIYDVYFADNQTGYFLENSGVYKSTDGGHNWNKISNLVGANLSVTPDGKVFFVNKNSKVYSSTNNGASFDSLNIAGGDLLADVYFIDNNNGFTFGNTKLFQTTNGGVSWDLVQPMTGATISNSGGTLSSIFFLNSNTGWIAFGNRCYRTNNSINDWQSTLTSFPSTQQIRFNCVFATDANTVFLTSYDGSVYKSVDGGINFSTLIDLHGAPYTPYTLWADIQFIDINVGYACHSLKLFKTVDGGNTWQPVVSMLQNDLIELYFKDSTHGWAVGEGGVVLIYHP